MPSALVIRAAGTNCDSEMCRAFELAGASPSLMHVDRLITDPLSLERFDIIGFPGGFSYGDDIASGRILAVRLRERLSPALRQAAARGVPMIGACNGFQVLVQVGLLPGGDLGDASDGNPPPQTAALSHNAGGRFIDRWVGVKAIPESPCIWTRGLIERFSGSPETSEVMMLPIAHGEGRFVASNDTLRSLRENRQVALTYTDNPNGSAADIAGICDPTGRVFGLMPHPERYLDWTLHPFWTRLDERTRRGDPPGLTMFREAVQAASHARV